MPSLGEPFNRVAYSKRENEFSYQALHTFPLRRYYGDVASYLPRIIAKTRGEIAEFNRRFSAHLPAPDGTYLFNLSGPVLFTPYSESATGTLNF